MNVRFRVLKLLRDILFASEALAFLQAPVSMAASLPFIGEIGTNGMCKHVEEAARTVSSNCLMSPSFQHRAGPVHARSTRECR